MKAEKRLSEVADTIKALAHRDRLAIFKMVCCGKKKRETVARIYGAMGIAQAVASRHLGILRASGLVIRRQTRNKVFYELNPVNTLARRISECLTEL